MVQLNSVNRDQRKRMSRSILSVFLIIGAVSGAIFFSKMKSMSRTPFDCNVLDSLLGALEEVARAESFRERGVMNTLEKRAEKEGFVIVEAVIVDAESREAFNRIVSGRKILRTSPLSNRGDCGDWTWIDRTYLGDEGQFNVFECETKFRKEGLTYSFWVLLRRSK